MQYYILVFLTLLSLTSNVFAQTQDTSRLIKPDFMVNTLGGEYGAEQNSPDIAVDGKGNYAIVWRDYRNAVMEIFAQFYDKSGEKLGGNVCVSDNSTYWDPSQPAIAGDPNGGFIVVWAQHEGYLLCQRFNTIGQKTGSNFRINNVIHGDPRLPSIAINNKGSFIVYWWDLYDNYFSRGYYRIFDKQAKGLTGDLTLDYGSARDMKKCAAADSKGNFVVVWATNAGDMYGSVFLQLINENGSKIEFPKLVSRLNEYAFMPSIASTDSGSFMISWLTSISYSQKGTLNIKLFSNSGKFIGPAIKLSEFDYYPAHAVLSNRKDKFTVLYNDTKLRYKVIELDSKTSAIGELKANQFITDITAASDTTGNLYLTSLEHANDNYDLFVDRFDRKFLPTGLKEMVSDDGPASWQENPIVHFNKYGESIVLWSDLRNGRSQLFAQVYDKDFNKAGSNILISDHEKDWRPAVKSLSDGTFVIAYPSLRFAYPTSLNFQKVSRSGEKSGELSHITPTNYPANIKMSINEKDEIFVCWYHYLQTLKFQKFSSDLVPLTDEKRILLSVYSPGLSGFDVSVNKNFKVLATWVSMKGLYPERVRGLIFNENGEAESDTFTIKNLEQINVPEVYNSLDDKNNYIVVINNYGFINMIRRYKSDKVYSFEKTYPATSYIAHHPQIILFQDQRAFVTLRGQQGIKGCWIDDNHRTDREYLLMQLEPNTDLLSAEYEANHTAIFNNKIFFTFQSGKNGGTGYDIWANVREADAVSTDSAPFLPPPNTDVLFNNYPNPFNAGTKIVYEVLAYHKVKLTVYDILGREVRVLVDENQERGVYEVYFDATGLASGIYFCRLDAFSTTIKKMVLVR